MLASEQCLVFDAVTLQHFAAVGRLDLLRELFGHRPEPRWTEEVFAEVERGAKLTESGEWCQEIIDADWMGDPGVAADLRSVLEIQAALATPGRENKNLGEAQSMALAIERGGVFVSDDSAAYDFAARRDDLGPTRTLDACSILQVAEGQSIISEADVREFHLAVAAAGRTMRCRCQYQP